MRDAVDTREGGARSIPAERDPGRFGRRVIFLLATLTLLIGWGYGLWRIADDRKLTLEASHQQLATLARALSSQFEAMVADGVGSALSADRLLRGVPDGAESLNVLSGMLTGGNYVRSLFLLRGESLTVANLPGEALGQGDMPWLAEMRASKADTWVGKVQVREPGDELLIPIARRVHNEDRVDWAGAMLRISDLGAVYAGLLSSHAAVALVHNNGRLITQVPREAVKVINLDLSTTGIYKKYQAMPKEPITMVVGPHPQTGQLRQFAASPVNGLPVFATGGRNVADALAAWRSRTTTSLVFMITATLVVSALAMALQRALIRRIMALQKSEERFQLAAAGTNDGLFEWESAPQRVYLTPHAMELLHLPEGTGMVKLEYLRTLVLPEDLPRVTGAFVAHVSRHIRLDVEARLLSGGQYRWFRIRGQAEWSAEGDVERLAGAIGDIDDAVQAQAAIAEARQAELTAKESLARELLAAQEQERRRLASELHDGIGQNLSLMRNRIVMMQRSDLPAAAAGHARTLLDLATESIEDLRTVAQNLRPQHLEELGIVTALRALLDKVQNASELMVHGRLEDIDDVIRGSSATHVYRIVQEAINNVLKHAQAHTLWVEASRDAASVVIRVRDDGRGFSNLAAIGAAGLGMLSMRERCIILGASLKIDSAASGTRIVVRIPIELEAGIGAAGSQDGQVAAEPRTAKIVALGAIHRA
jgi:signal transduction histidine kinase